MVEVKFCGLTRPEDAARAAELGASYAGVIFAGGPRLLTPGRAREVFAPLAGTGVRRVGVFGHQGVDEVASLATAAGVDVVQLHGDPTGAAIARLRTRFAGRVWAVRRLADAALPPGAAEIASAADGVVLDAAVPGRLGGTGVALDWAGLGPAVGALRAAGREGMPIVLAGGLRPGNVARAVALVRPDVVDVSSGVESVPGVKDPEAMRAFMVAAREASAEER